MHGVAAQIYGIPSFACKLSGDSQLTSSHHDKQGHLDLVRTLRYLGADIFAINDEGITPGALAARRYAVVVGVREGI
jgi:hypothetical protein